MSKLNLDRDKVESCRKLAQKIAARIQEFVDQHTTVSIERSTLRLLGVEESFKGRPLVNAVVESLSPQELSRGVFYWIGRALAAHRSSVISLCLRAAEGRLKWRELPEADFDDVRRVTEPLARQALRRLDESRSRRRKSLDDDIKRPHPLKYVIVATGNIHEDVDQAKSAVLAGADCIAVIRSTAQSLMDYVPHGATTEGFGGTYATQENFRIMRKALDEAGARAGRHVRLVNYSSGLCMPEIAVMGALEGLDYLLNDSMYGILFRDISMKRTFTDQHFSRLVIARAGIVINTGEDNYLTTAESFRAFHQVVASQFINERLARNANLREEQIGLGHAFEMDPAIEDSLLYEIAQAEMVREIFPHSPIKYMPPTRHMSGDIFFGHVLDAMFNLVSVMTHQDIHLLGMLTEGIHNPLLQDRFMSLKATNYAFKAARSLGDEIAWSENGKVVRRARSVLEDCHQLLLKVEKTGLMKSISQGFFANMAREIDGGRGVEGVLRRDPHYWNPVLKLLEKNSEEESEFSQHGHARHPHSRDREERSQRPVQDRHRGDRGRRSRGRHRRRGGRREAGASGGAPSQAAPAPKPPVNPAEGGGS